MPALAILIPMILDLSSDSALTASYYSDFSNDTLTNSCITSSISNEPLKVEISWSQIELVELKVSKKIRGGTGCLIETFSKNPDSEQVINIDFREGGFLSYTRLKMHSILNEKFDLLFQKFKLVFIYFKKTIFFLLIRYNLILNVHAWITTIFYWKWLNFFRAVTVSWFLSWNFKSMKTIWDKLSWAKCQMTSPKAWISKIDKFLQLFHLP